MKKTILSAIFFAIITAFATAEAPELKNMMPNSWRKLTRLSEQEEKEFLRETDVKQYYTKENYGNVLSKCENVYTQIYREYCNGMEIYRVLSAEVPLADALSITVEEATYTDEQKENLLRRNTISEIDFLKEEENCRYITSTRYGYTKGYQTGFGYMYGNILYRAINDKDVGVFITEAVHSFEIWYNNKFVFKKCKNQIQGGSDCVYYNLKDLLENREDREIRISASDYLVDPKCPLKYSIQNAFDGNPATSYVENTEDDLMKIDVDSLFIKVALINGYAQNQDLYEKNNRIKTIAPDKAKKNKVGHIELTIDYDRSFSVKDDSLTMQIFNYGEKNCGIINITDIYKGTKYKDTCLAELNLYSETEGWLFGDIDE